MRKSILILISTLFILTGCATSRAPGLNMLEVRADYSGENYINNELSGNSTIPNITAPKVEDIYIYPHEMPSGDYFRGGWIRTLVSKGQWQLEEVRPKAIKNEKDLVTHKKRQVERPLHLKEAH